MSYKNTDHFHQRQCLHPGLLPVWGNEAPNIFAGARADLRGDYDVVLDCTGSSATLGAARPPAVRLSSGLEADRFMTLLDMGRPDPVTIALDWPDGGVPPVRAEFWAELLATLAGDRLAIFCMGGHGRTGTALTALAMVMVQQRGYTLTLHDIVRDLRRNYCSHIVETGVQVAYLTGLAATLGVAIGDPITGSYAQVMHAAPTTTAQPVVKNAQVSYATSPKRTRSKPAQSRKLKGTRDLQDRDLPY